MSNTEKTSKQEKIKEILGKYRRAGEIAKEAKALARELAVPGASVLELCEEIEGLIRKNGAVPAFPVNVSINEVAAHYSAIPNDDLKLPKEGVVKVDLGAHVDGYIVDTAISILLGGNHEKLVQASIEALENAIATVKPNMHVSEIGKVIEKAAKKYGYRTIGNLTGHQIKRYNLHAGLSIPNVGSRLAWLRPSDRVQKGRVYAIEPFVTYGRGLIYEGKDVTIFSFQENFSGLKKEEKEVAQAMKEIVGPLPFSHRWLVNAGYSVAEVEKYLTLFMKKNVVHGYGTLIDVDRKIVSQHEHTIRVKQDGVEIFT